MAMFMQRRESHIPFTLLLTYGFLSVVIQSLLAANVTLASTTFRIITYNVQFLPEPVSSQNKRPQPEYRAGRIAEEVSPFDLVALQEMFHDRHRLTLMGRLRTAWHNKLQALYSPTPKGFYTSGGCLLMTRLPMRDKSSLVFTDYSQPQDYGLRADGFAAKGVIHARIAPARRNLTIRSMSMSLILRPVPIISAPNSMPK